MEDNYSLDPAFVDTAVTLISSLDSWARDVQMVNYKLDLFDRARAHGASVVDAVIWADEIIARITRGLAE